MISGTLLRKLEKVPPDLRDVLITLVEEVERQREESVTKKEFNELKEIVRDLAEAQKKLAEAQIKTEGRVNELAEAQKKTEQKLDELVEAQKKTEQRLNELAEAQKLTEQRLNELTEAQRKTEQKLNELAEAQKKTEERLDKLAEAQRKTEERLNELAEAQRKTEQRLNELAEAQRKTEEELKKLVGEHRKTREELGKLSHSVGYVLEDRAIVHLPRLLKKDEGVDVEELKRDFVELGPGRYEEINILGKGYKGNKPVWIIGECKTQFKKKDVEGFLKKLEKIERFFPGERILIAVTYQSPPQIQELLKEKGIRLYFSYLFGF
ncbi:MAG: hypothetical protein WHS38_05875 [Thermodesulforhabdaceae bacterium]